jgi:hypothetical protein
MEEHPESFQKLLEMDEEECAPVNPETGPLGDNLKPLAPRRRATRRRGAERKVISDQVNSSDPSQDRDIPAVTIFNPDNTY